MRISPGTPGKTGSQGSVLGWISVPALLILLVALVVGSSTGWDLNRAGYVGIQRNWFISLNSALATWPRGFWFNVNDLGRGDVLLVLLSPLLIWIPRSWAAMLCAAPIAASLSATIKDFAAVPRPAAVMDPQLFTVIGETLTGSNSLPSGHSITVFTAAIACLASMRLKPQRLDHWYMLLVVVCLAAVVCLARIAVGAHWPLDLVVGAACGWIAGLCGAMLTHYYPRSWHWSLTTGGRRVAGGIVLVVSLSLAYIGMTESYAPVALWLAVASGIVTALRLSVENPAAFFWNRDPIRYAAPGK